MNKKEKLILSAQDESLIGIGKVVVCFAALESKLDFAIWLLLIPSPPKEQRTAQIVTAELMFSNKVALLSALYQHRFPEKKPFNELQKILKKLKSANQKRNDLIHSTWLAGDMKLATSAKEKRGLKFDFQDFGVEKIEEVASLICDAMKDMEKFYLSFLLRKQ